MLQVRATEITQLIEVELEESDNNGNAALFAKAVYPLEQELYRTRNHAAALVGFAKNAVRLSAASLAVREEARVVSIEHAVHERATYVREDALLRRVRAEHAFKLEYVLSVLTIARILRARR